MIVIFNILGACIKHISNLKLCSKSSTTGVHESGDTGIISGRFSRKKKIAMKRRKFLEE
jgi:hypothetical protein